MQFIVFQNLMDVLTSIGLHNLVAFVQSKLSHPPPYDVVNNSRASARSMFPYPDTNHYTNESQQRPVTPPRIPRMREPTEHESLPIRPAASRYSNNSSLPASIMSLEGFSLDGKTGIYWKFCRLHAQNTHVYIDMFSFLRKDTLFSTVCCNF